MASAQQIIGLVKSHAEGDKDRFYDLAMQLAAAESQKGHSRLAEQLRQWAEAGASAPEQKRPNLTPLAAPRGELSGFLGASYPTARMADVIVPPVIEDELRHLVVEIHHAEKLEERGLRPRRRVLLAGPPGTGKTLTAAALSAELRYPLFTVLLHGLITKFMGETAQKLRMVFDAIKTTRGVYLFDEIDALASSRGNENDIGEARRVLNSFLQFLDEDTGPSIIIATTNLPELLDRAVLRRFDLVLSYDLPNEDAIEKAMRRRLHGFDVGAINWSQITGCADGLSTADVIAAAEDAARRAVILDSGAVETSAVVASLERRRSLQGIGTDKHGSRSAPLHTARNRKSTPVRSKNRRIVKTSE
ncbi:ATP-binding protein [Rhizobium leguminosarum]|uniref:AAA family ATPase n=1 Tax=Rhizobium leguminosarum TaxID=384 RepID=UPI001C968015|nr:ATP-binding protein [Rhizobium leguminosarum]MBY5570530.1 ATP-binding protein [Rhizobium leguminosarum]MBY5577003.1 ATP-binding protein [Rhizobium leguminosarum]